MKTPNLITESLQLKQVITKKVWDTWNTELKRDITTPLAANSAIALQKETVQKKIALLQVHLNELIRARKALKTPSEKSFLPVSDQLISTASDEILNFQVQENILLAGLESQVLNWTETEKITNDLIIYADQSKNGIKTIQLTPEVYLLKARATYMLTGENTKVLMAALKLFPNNEHIRRELASNEIRNGKFDKAFDLIKGNIRAGSRIQEILDAILIPVSTDQKELAYPCNFYTYQYNLMTDNSRFLIETYLNKHRNFTQTGTNGSNTSVNVGRTDEFEDVMRVFCNVFKEWQNGINLLHQKKYSGAIACFSKTKELAIRILRRYNDKIDTHGFANRLETRTFEFFPEELEYSLRIMFTNQTVDNQSNEFYTYYFKSLKNERNAILDVESLYQHDWKKPLEKTSDHGSGNGPIYDGRDPSTLEHFLFHPIFSGFARGLRSDLGQGPEGIFTHGFVTRYQKIDYPLMMIAAVFTGFATIEAYRFSNQQDKALEEIDRLLALHTKFQLLNPVIEFPFLKLLQAQILKEKAEKEFKSGTLSSGLFGRLSLPLKALNTYQKVLDVLNELGDYKTAMDASISDFNNKLSLLITNRTLSSTVIRESKRTNRTISNALNNSDRIELQKIGKRIYIPKVKNYDPGVLPLTPPKKYPLQRLLAIGNHTTSFKETNPLVYAIYLEAQTRITQINQGFNYIGYRNDFIPPWRFNFLLDRARYYVDQTKNLQRDYLNFLSNAEREEFQEAGAGQAVSMERMNLTVENSRVDLSTRELEISKESNELASMQVNHATQRKANFDEYDQVADTADLVSGIAAVASSLPAVVGAIAGATGGTAAAPGLGTIPGAVLGVIAGGAAATGEIAQLVKDGARRDMEQKDLSLSIEEATQAAEVSRKQFESAQQALLISNLQAQAALMRSEFAKDNYEYLRNRLTNAELWFRLAHHVREIANTYFRRAIEMSFLAEQAYEFIVDKKVDVIRFDYDNDELGAMLGADYLKADLDYLENHLIVNQKEKQQQVKCVISLARDFPQALQDLRENEQTIIPISLQYLERRFPGLYQIKIAGVDLQPLAIVNPTRFNMELTHLGSGIIRTQTNAVHEDGTGEDLNNNFDQYGNVGTTQWIPDLEILFPVKTLLNPVETALFSGLSISEESAHFQSFSSQQKSSFEDYPAAGGWLLDMGMAENEMVPGSLADVVLTFYMTGYHSADLKSQIELAWKSENELVTNSFSAQRIFPDEFFNFQRSGRIAFKITPDMLTMNKRISNLKELSFRLIPSKMESAANRFSSIHFSTMIYKNNKIETSYNSPQMHLDGNGMFLTITLANIKNRTIEIFAAENPSVVLKRTTHSNDTHTFDKLEFNKQGKQTVILRETTGGKLQDYPIEVFVSKTEKMILPVTSFMQTKLTSGKILALESFQLINSTSVIKPAPEKEHNMQCFIIDNRGNILANTTDPGDFELNLSDFEDLTEFSVVSVYTKKVTPSFKCNQDTSGYKELIEKNTLRTNVKTHGGPDNPLTGFSKHLFGANLKTKIKSPIDEWQLTIDPSENPFIICYDCSGSKLVDTSIFSDLILTMEYELSSR